MYMVKIEPGYNACKIKFLPLCHRLNSYLQIQCFYRRLTQKYSKIWIKDVNAEKKLPTIMEKKEIIIFKILFMKSLCAVAIVKIFSNISKRTSKGIFQNRIKYINFSLKEINNSVARQKFMSCFHKRMFDVSN